MSDQHSDSQIGRLTTLIPEEELPGLNDPELDPLANSNFNNFYLN
jgi:hypothetical protein